MASVGFKPSLALTGPHVRSLNSNAAASLYSERILAIILTLASLLHTQAFRVI